jgi:hypothetical protein
MTVLMSIISYTAEIHEFVRSNLFKTTRKSKRFAICVNSVRGTDSKPRYNNEKAQSFITGPDL